MPFNTNFVDATTTKTPIVREYFDRDTEAAAFADALLQTVNIANNSSANLLYIGTTSVQQVDHEAASRIAWLRAKTYDLGKNPDDDCIVGALGEWVVLRYPVASDTRIKAVSLVSFVPVSEPDFSVSTHTPIVHIPIEEAFDIKTTESKNNPKFNYCPVKHHMKGNPHIVGVVLNKDRTRADIFLRHAKTLITPNELDNYLQARRQSKLDVIGVLKANLIG